METPQHLIKSLVKERFYREKEDILLSTKKEGRRLLEKQDREFKLREEKLKKEIDHRLRIEEARMLSLVHNQNLKLMLQKREEFFKELINYVLSNLQKLRKTKKYQEVFKKLLNESLEKFPEKSGTLIVPVGDRKWAQKFLNSIKLRNVKLKIEEREDCDSGLILESRDARIRVYNTFIMRLERAKSDIMEALSREVWMT